MVRRRLVLWSLTMSLIVAVSACGSDDATSDEPAADAATEAAEDVEAAEDAEPAEDADPSVDLADAGSDDEQSGGELDGAPCLALETVAELTGLELDHGGPSSGGNGCTYDSGDLLADQNVVTYRIDRFLDEPPGYGDAVDGYPSWAEHEPGVLLVGVSEGALEVDGRAGRDDLGLAELRAVADAVLADG